MKHIFSLLALSLSLVFLSCSNPYEGTNVGGASDPQYCNAPSLIEDASQSSYPLSAIEKATYTEGCEIYVVKCANCHMLDGATINAGLDLNDAEVGATADTNCTTCEAHSWLSDKISSSMPPERGESTYLSIQDAAKVATYIRANFYNDMTPANDTLPENLPESIRPSENLVNKEGQQLYISKSCAACHGSDGTGTGQYDAPMTYYTTDRNRLINKLLNGGGNPGYSTTTHAGDVPMPTIGEALTSEEAGQIADYMNEDFNYGW